MERSSSVGQCLRALALLVVLTHCVGGTETESPEALDVREDSAVAATTYTFTPIADARVEEAAPTRNLGIESTLIADLSPHTESFLRFSLSGVKGTVTRARLRLYVSDGTSDGPKVFTVERYWEEESLT